MHIDKDIKTLLENMSQDDLQKVKDSLETLLENKEKTTVKNKQR